LVSGLFAVCAHNPAVAVMSCRMSLSHRMVFSNSEFTFPVLMPDNQRRLRTAGASRRKALGPSAEMSELQQGNKYVEIHSDRTRPLLLAILEHSAEAKNRLTPGSLPGRAEKTGAASRRW